MSLTFPGVEVNELDFSQYAEQQRTTALGLVGVANKGPLHKRTLITSVPELIETFGKPPALTGAQSAVQIVTVTGATGGTLTLAYNGIVASQTIAWNATNADVEAALATITGLTAADLVVEGAAGGPWTVYFVNALANRAVPNFTVAVNALTGSPVVSIRTSREGRSAPGDYSMQAAINYLQNGGRQLYFTRTCRRTSGAGWLAQTASIKGGFPRWRNQASASQRVTITGTPTGGTFTLTYSGTVASPLGTPQTTSGIAYNAVAAAVQTALESLAGIGAGNVAVSGSAGGPYTITFQGALANTHITSLSATASLTGGTSPAVAIATLVTGAANGDIQIAARSPGTWANDLAVSFTKLEGSRNAIQDVTITGSPSGGTFTLSFGGQVTSGLAFNANAATVQAALTGLSTIGSGNAVVTLTGNVYRVTFQGALANTPVAALVGVSSLTGGTSPNVVVSQFQTGIVPAENVYTMNVWDVLSPTTGLEIVESFPRVMLVNDDTLLQQNAAYYIATMVNDGVPNVQGASSRIRITGGLPNGLNEILLDIGTSVSYLDGGESAVDTYSGTSGDGDAAYIGTETDAVFGATALQTFRSAETGTRTNVLAISGVVSNAVLTALVSLVEQRRDCIALIDPPEKLTAAEVTDWHNRQGNFVSTGYKPNSSYAAVYWPWVQTFDQYNAASVFVPPSAVIPAVIAYNDDTAAQWFAPAGEIRGRVITALRLQSETPAQGRLEAMYSGGNVVNVIRDFSQSGVVVWGQRTTQRRATDLDRINVRRLVIWLRLLCEKSLQSVVFAPNDAQTRREIKSLLEPALQNLVNNRGVYEYKIQCDDKNNTASIISQNRLIVDVGIRPVKAAEFITVNLALGSTGTSVTN